MINLSQQIGDMSLGGIIISLALVALICAGILLYLRKLLNTDRLPDNYPTLDDVQNATDKQITTWAHTLPAAKSEQELEVIQVIVSRYINLTD